ncbi:response regulator [Serratia sp. L9]|uniref:response regulator n=1 Tax=Serratia sp. L9 TaxID=3423946 RepID=UPI003D66F215
MINEKVSLFTGIAAQKELALGWSSSLESNVRFWLDPQPFGQVLINLIGNAVKFTQQGTISVTAASLPATAGHRELIITVEDTGPGISPQQQGLLFKPFIQADAGHRQSGSGLGLAISKDLFSLMGEIALQSQPGQGTTFTLRLIVAIDFDSNEQDEPELSPVATPRVSSQPLAILIVDDHPANRLLLQRQLLALGEQADEADNGIEALNALQNQHYDLLITDLNMPDMDGIALAKAIRQTDNEMTIWGLTASAQPHEYQQCIAAGMNACLFKPLNLQQLESLLNTLHQKWQNSSYDLNKLTLLAMGNRALMKNALEDAQKENRHDLSMAFSALDKGDTAALKHHLHRINGTAQLLGANRLHRQVEALEMQLLSAFDAANTHAELKRTKQLLEELDDAIMQFEV